MDIIQRSAITSGDSSPVYLNQSPSLEAALAFATDFLQTSIANPPGSIVEPDSNNHPAEGKLRRSKVTRKTNRDVNKKARNTHSKGTGKVRGAREKYTRIQNGDRYKAFATPPAPSPMIENRGDSQAKWTQSCSEILDNQRRPGDKSLYKLSRPLRKLRDGKGQVRTYHVSMNSQSEDDNDSIASDPTWKEV